MQIIIEMMSTLAQNELISTLSKINEDYIEVNEDIIDALGNKVQVVPSHDRSLQTTTNHTGNFFGGMVNMSLQSTKTQEEERQLQSLSGVSSQ